MDKVEELHRRRFASRAMGLVVALALVGCGGTTVFQGQTPFTVAGSPPPPPPPKEPEPKPRVEVRDNKIEIHEKIQFDYNKATIKPVSHSLLDEVVDVIKKHPHIKKIRVEGHASSEGDAEYNLKLSDRRAKSVKDYLVEHGIPDNALTSQGYGATRPIADNDTEAGREKNRRVEFNITEQDITKKKVEIDPKTGKERVIETVKE